MPLYKINEFDPNYHNNPGSDAIQNFDVYTDRNEKIGKAIDALLDQGGNFRYLVVELKSWMSSKQVLVPVGRSQVDTQHQRIYISGLTKSQAAKLPAYHGSSAVDAQYEQQVRAVYHTRSLEDSGPLEASGALEGPRVVHRAPAQPVRAPQPAPPVQPMAQPTPVPPVQPMAHSAPMPPVQPTTQPAPTAAAPDVYAYQQVHSDPVPPVQPAPTAAPDVYSYQQDPDLYEINERYHQPFVQYQEQLRATRRPAFDIASPQAPQPTQGQRVVSEEVIPLKEERLVVDRQKRKTGEVVVRKEIETEIIEVPVQREKLIVEEVGAEPRQLAEIDLHDQETLGADMVDPNTQRVIRTERRSPQNPPL